MLISIAKYTVLAFGILIIFSGFLMLFKPQKARATLRRAGILILLTMRK